MNASIFKYFNCYLIEKHHRFVFDNCYICKNDKHYKPLTIRLKLIRFTYHYLTSRIYSDFRAYLKWWSEFKKSDYIRYSGYEY